jgi:hypothetical protein
MKKQILYSIVTVVRPMDFQSSTSEDSRTLELGIWWAFGLKNATLEKDPVQSWALLVSLCTSSHIKSLFQGRMGTS